MPSVSQPRARPNWEKINIQWRAGPSSRYLRKDDRFLDAFGDAVPVAVELRRNAESLIEFDDPDNALYVFGPEDGAWAGGSRPLPPLYGHLGGMAEVSTPRDALERLCATFAALTGGEVKRQVGPPAVIEVSGWIPGSECAPPGERLYVTVHGLLPSEASEKPPT